MELRDRAERAAHFLLGPSPEALRLTQLVNQLDEQVQEQTSRIAELEEERRDDRRQIQLLEEQLKGVNALAKQQVLERQEHLSALQEDRDKHVRIAAENFEVVCSMAKQRDEWQQIYHTQSRENLTAQKILGQHLMRARDVAIRLLNALNKLRKEHDMRPIKGDQDLPSVDASPVGGIEEFAHRIKELHDQMPRSIEPSAAQLPEATSPPG